MGCTTNKSTVTAAADTLCDFHDEYVLGAKLGRGAFAQVRLCTSVRPECAKERAVKILDLRPSEKEDEKKAPSRRELRQVARDELFCWESIGPHKNVLRLIEAFESKEVCFMVMEKCSSSLFKHFTDVSKVDERSLGNIFSQMLQGIAHVHSAHVAHRDIKPDNFLVGGKDGQTIKVADFGLSAPMPKDGSKLKGVHGTAPFMSPEMLKGEGYDMTADVWSLGIVVYTLLYGDFAYVPAEKCSPAMKRAIVKGDPPSFEPNCSRAGEKKPKCSRAAEDFARELLRRDAAKRISASEALNLTYMVAIADDKHLQGEDLPSMRSMIHSAKKAGAFEFYDRRRPTSLDSLLHEAQMERHNIPLPEAGKVTTPSTPKNKPVPRSPNRLSVDTSDSVSKSPSFGAISACGTSSIATSASGGCGSEPSTPLSPLNAFNGGQIWSKGSCDSQSFVATTSMKSQNLEWTATESKTSMTSFTMNRFGSDQIVGA